MVNKSAIAQATTVMALVRVEYHQDAGLKSGLKQDARPETIVNVYQGESMNKKVDGLRELPYVKKITIFYPHREEELITKWNVSYANNGDLEDAKHERT